MQTTPLNVAPYRDHSARPSPAGRFHVGAQPMPMRPPIHRPTGMPSREVAEARRKAVLDRKRPSAADRGYDNAWRAVRKQFLKANPTCCMCGQPATEVDHIVSIRERPDLRLRWSNLRALDRSCHSRRTALEQGFARKT